MEEDEDDFGCLSEYLSMFQQRGNLLALYLGVPEPDTDDFADESIARYHREVTSVKRCVYERLNAGLETVGVVEAINGPKHNPFLASDKI